MNGFQVRCIKMMSNDAITAEFDGIVVASFEAEEWARLLVISAKAAEHSF